MLTVILLFDAFCLEIKIKDSVVFSARDFLSALFFFIGYVFKKYEVNHFGWLGSFASVGTVFVGSFFWLVATCDYTYDNIRVLPYTVTAVLGTWTVYSLPWHKLHGTAARTLQFIGENTLAILTWHFLCFKLVSYFIVRLYGLPMERLAEFPVISEYVEQGWWVVYFAVAIIITCVLSFCNRWIKSSWLKL